MYCDYHTHTPLCLHASGTPQEYVQAAVRAGLREYGISDHAPMPGEPFDDWRMKQADMPAYLDWLTEARLVSRHWARDRALAEPARMGLPDRVRPLSGGEGGV